MLYSSPVLAMYIDCDLIVNGYEQDLMGVFKVNLHTQIYTYIYILFSKIIVHLYSLSGHISMILL